MPRKKTKAAATQIIHAKKSPEVLKVEKIIKDASPLELLIRTSRGEPSISVHTLPEQDPETGQLTVTYSFELCYPDEKTRSGAQRDCVGYVSPRLSAVQNQEVKERVINVMEVPLIGDSSNGDDWEKFAMESQAETVAEGRK